MIEAEPTFTCRIGQLGEALVDRFPIAKHAQAFRFTFKERLLHAMQTEVVDIMVKVDVYGNERICK